MKTTQLEISWGFIYSAEVSIQNMKTQTEWTQNKTGVNQATQTTNEDLSTSGVYSLLSTYCSSQPHPLSLDSREIFFILEICPFEGLTDFISLLIGSVIYQ